MTLSTPFPGTATGLPEPAWSDAFNASDTALIRIEGLTHAAFMLADNHPALGGPDAPTAALTEVLRALVEAHEPLRELRSTEYRAGLAVECTGRAKA